MPSPRATSPQLPTSRLTVLLPPSRTRDESQIGLQTEDTHYTFSQKQDNLTLSLTGSLVNRDESSIIADKQGPPAGNVRGVPFYITQNEGVKTATWIENGTAYALDIECTRQADERCRSTDYIKSILGSLVPKAQ